MARIRIDAPENRLAALLEKAGLPQDRLLIDAELAAAIDLAGENLQTYYLGHDYDNTGLVSFTATQADDPATPQDETVDERRHTPAGSCPGLAFKRA